MLKAKIKDKYLNPDGADFWFVFGDEKVPGHRFVLETMSPWLNKMLNGSLPVEREANMSNCGITVEAFKEFLRFLYLGEVNFTMDNIEEIINLAKLSLVDEFFVECEYFLIKSLTIENMFMAYKLALLYDANRLKDHCEEEIGLNAEEGLKTSAFLNFSYELLENLLKCDALTCEEKYIFDACIAWAKAACERNGQDPMVLENIRAQLKDALYQIRFNLMTKEEAADCILSFRALFTIEELEEIICMIGRKTEFQTKKFNWTERKLRLQLQRKNKRELMCSRYRFFMSYFLHYFRLVEQTTFESNKRLILNGFSCEGIWDPLFHYPGNMMQYLVDVTISKINSNDHDDIRQIFNQPMVLNFTENPKRYFSKIAHIKFEPAILIQPMCKYMIKLQFATQPLIRSNCALERRVRVDHNIVIKFDDGSGAISSLNISRIDEENYFEKICQNPKVYLTCMVIGYFFVKRLCNR